MFGNADTDWEPCASTVFILHPSTQPRAAATAIAPPRLPIRAAPPLARATFDGDDEDPVLERGITVRDDAVQAVVGDAVRVTNWLEADVEGQDSQTTVDTAPALESAVHA